MKLHTLLDQRVTIVTASRRLAHAIRLDYACEVQQRGESVWHTPRVLPWSTWLRQQYLETRATAATATFDRVLTASQERALWDDIVAASPAAEALLNPSSAARLASRSWRKLNDYRIPLAELLRFDTAETQAFHAWAKEFVRRCEGLRAIDESRLTQWADAVAFVPAERLACAGFDTIPPAMARLLERWRDAGRVIESEAGASVAPSTTIVAAADETAELEAAAQWAREQTLAGAGHVGIIVSDLANRRAAVQRIFGDTFAPGERRTGRGEQTIPVVVAAPPPLSSYPIIDSALLALQLAGGGGSIEAGRILRSPFFAGGEAEPSRRALADVRLREEQREQWDWFEMERWASLTQCERLALAARDLNAILREASNAALPSEWAERFQAMWLSIGWPGDRPLNSIEHQSVEKLQDVLADFGGLDLVSGRMGLRRAVSRLRELAGETVFEPETTAGAVTVIDAATSAGMRFDALWVTGLDADRLPPPAVADPLLPLELQRTAGIPEASAAGALQQAIARLQRWAASADQVVFSWPQRAGDAELSASPLLAPYGNSGPALAMPPGSLRRTLFAARPVIEEFRDDRAPALPADATRGGARTLELQSGCPFRAQAELRLDARVLPRVSVGVEPVDRGAILHRVLEEVWGVLRSHDRLTSAGEAELARLVRDSAQRHAAQALRADTRHRVRLMALEIESISAQVLRLLEVEKQRAPFRVRFAEAAQSYSLGGLSITLRPDRIDELMDGGTLLLDYKLGGSNWPRDWFDVLPGRPRRPQLPLYGLAQGVELRGLAYVIVAPGTVEYRGWSDGAAIGPGVAPYPSGLRIDLGDPSDWTALQHHWRFTLTRLAEHYVAGDAHVDPLPLACAGCHLSTFCRIHEIEQRSADRDGAT